LYISRYVKTKILSFEVSVPTLSWLEENTRKANLLPFKTIPAQRHGRVELRWSGLLLDIA
jgi:hypothetical protein